MAKKDLANVATNLASLAAPLPTQRPPEPARVKEERGKAEERESEVQFSLSMPVSVRKELAMRAIAADMTMRGFILNALREQGIEVSDGVIADARRKD